MTIYEKIKIALLTLLTAFVVAFGITFLIEVSSISATFDLLNHAAANLPALNGF